MSSLSLVLRIAWRNALRHKLSTVLTALLVALPVVALVTAAVLGQSTRVPQSEQLRRDFGTSDFKVFADAEHPALQPLVKALPAGSRLLVDRQERLALQSPSHAGVTVRDLTYSDPMARGVIRQDSGRAPAAQGEAGVSTYLAQHLHLSIGQTLTLDDGRHLRIVGTVTDPQDVHSREVLTLSPAVSDARPVSQPGNTSEYVFVDLPAGVAAGSIGQLPDPFSADLRPTEFRYAARLPAATIGTGALVAVLALIISALTAGTAFAVGARRARRDLALVAVNGGRGLEVAGVILAGGVLFGVAGIVIGVVGGIAIADAALPTLQHHSSHLLVGLQVHAAYVAGAAAFGFVTAIVASLQPARLAARTSLRSALGGTRGTSSTPRWITVTGAAMFVVGVLVVVAAVRNSVSIGNETTVALFGVVLVELGGVCVCPALLGVAGRLGARLPALPRLALRDSARQRARTGPAVAAIAAAVSGAVAVSVYAASYDLHQRQTYVPAFARTAADIAGPVSSQQLQDIFGADAAAQAVTIRYFDSSTLTEQDPDPVPPPPGANSANAYAIDVQGWIAPPAALDLLGASPAAKAAFAKGVPVVTPNTSADAVWTLNGTKFTPVEAGWKLAQSLPGIVIPESFAREVRAEPIAGVADETLVPLSATLSNGARSALETKALDLNVYAQIDTGPSDEQSLAALALIGVAALFSLIVTAAATALAAQESAPDLAVLGAVGATGRVRRLFTAAQGATTAVLGGVLGLAIGLVPGIAVVKSSTDHLPLSLPWEPFVYFLIGLPVLAALGGVAFTRSRLPGMQRAL